MNTSLRKQFVICIGSQRAGSTLLHRILDEASAVYMHPLKELHYFDTLYGRRPYSQLRSFCQEQLDRECNEKGEAVCSLLSTKAYGDKYVNYIRTLLLLKGLHPRGLRYMALFKPCIDSYHYLGESTPEYMLLSDREIAGTCSVLGREARIILMVRNPVKRFISAAKLLIQFSGQGDNSRNAENIQGIIALLQRDAPWIDIQKQYSDYAGALKRYRKHFRFVLPVSLDDLVLNSDKTIQEISEFLDAPISFEIAARICKTKENKSDIELEMTSELLDLVIEKTGIYSSEYVDKIMPGDLCL